MSRRRDRERAEAGIIYRNGVPVSASAWERQRQSTIADLEAAAEKGRKELAGVLAILGHAIGTGISVTELRHLWDKAVKGGKV
jgi:hypothetical protein